jgi:hypothetical protein
VAEVTQLPVASLRAALPYLRRPFTPEAIKFKVQAQFGSQGLIVAYIDARLVIERLNMVVAELWHDEYEPFGDRIDSGFMWCHLTVAETTRSDVGESKGKGLVSDALKRAAVRFGVGASLYAIPRFVLGATKNGSVDSNNTPTLKIVNSKNKDSYRLTPECEAWLRAKYSDWLTQTGAPNFGEALDHGDVVGSIGDPDEAVPEESAQEDLELAAEREAVEQLYAEKIVAGNGTKSKFPKGRFTAQLKAADTPEKLAEIRAKIEEVAA